MNLANERRRLVVMLAATGAGFVIALVGMVSYAILHARWGLGLFAVGVVGGVIAQLRFIMGVVRGAAKV